MNETQTAVKTAIRKCRKVFVNVRISEHNCAYIQAVKADVLTRADEITTAQMHDGNLYID